MARPEATGNTSCREPGPGRTMRRIGAALAASAALLAPPLPLAAQDSAPQRLEDLIPDEAVADPEGWAAQGIPADIAAEGADQPELDADAPLADMPLIDLPWPEDLEPVQLAPLEPESDLEFATFEGFDNGDVELGAPERISDELMLVFPSERSLFPQRDEFLDRFRSLSTIEELDADDNAARLAAQADEDEDLLVRMLRVYGYYDAIVSRSIGAPEEGRDDAAAGQQPNVRFEILPGRQYQVGTVDLGRLREAGPDYPMLRESFEVRTGDPLLSDKIVEERYELDLALGESGYPFAEIDEPELLVDHARLEGDLTMAVRPEGKYTFGRVVSNQPDFLSSNHLGTIARFEPGDLYQRSLELDLRQAVLATGIVGSVEMTPVPVREPGEDGEPGTVDIAVDMTEARLRTIAGSLGYGTGEGFRAAGRWEHRNLFPPEGMLRVRGIAGTREQLAGVTFRRNNLGGRDRILTLDAFVSTIDYDAYDARTVSLVGTFERISTLLYQKPFSWSVGLELVATGEAEILADGERAPRQTYFVGALPLYAQIDTSDDMLEPSEGFRLGAWISPEVSSSNDVQSFYLRGQVQATHYRQISENVVLAGRARFGSIPGAPLSAIAPSRRLYAGGGGSVRGYGYQAIGPQNSAGDPVGGRSLTELSLEARIRTGLLGGALGIVPFIDAGTVGADPTPGFDEIKVGVGVGARYYTGFGPLRLDVGFPLNPGPNDSFVGVYVALGQAF